MKCKKLFALALAMVMCVPMSFNALAAQNSTTQASPATSIDTDGDTILDGYLRLWTLDVNFDNGKFIYHATPEYSGRQYEAWINVI